MNASTALPTPSLPATATRDAEAVASAGATGRSSRKTARTSPPAGVRYKLAGYVRLSPSDEIREEGSLVSHPQRIQSYVTFKNTQQPGWGEVVEWYVDKDYSGKDTNRPALRRMLQDIQLGVVNAVIVTELSRLSRDVKDFCQLWEFLRRHNATFFSLKENFDTSTPIGEMMVIQCISFAQFERKTIVQRIKDGARARAERGLANGRSYILGYDRHPHKKHHLVVNEAEAAVVRHVFDRFLELGCLAKLRRDLNAAGYRTKSFTTKDGQQRGGQGWLESSLHLLLTNTRYLGKVEINRQNRDRNQDELPESERYRLVDAAWPAIVPEPVFARAQEILATNRRFGKFHRHVYRLSGVLQCGLCGEDLVGVSANGKGGKYFYYGHKRKLTRSKGRHGHRCALERIPAVRLEEAIIGRLVELAKDKRLLAQLAAKASAEGENVARDLASMIAAKEQERREIERQINNLMSVLADNPAGASAKTILAKVEDLERLRQEVSGSLAELRRERDEGGEKVVDLEAVARIFRAFERGFAAQPAHVQRDVVRQVVHRVIVQNTGTIRLLYHTRAPEEGIELAPDAAAEGDQGSQKVKTPGLASARSGVRLASRGVGVVGLEPTTSAL